MTGTPQVGPFMCSTLRLRRWRFDFLLLPTLLCLVALPAAQVLAQAHPSSLPPNQPGDISTYDPTRPEVQPNLGLDQDPVMSPDLQDNAPVSARAARANETGSGLQKNKSGVFTLQENVNEVLLNCTVLDQKGRLVTGLKGTDFRLWEDNVPQTIDSFQHQDLPVSLGILVDNSGSMRDKRAAVSLAALDLVKASNPADAAFVVNFSDRAYLDQTFTSNLAAVERGLAHFEARNTTALYDAVVASANELANHAKQPKQVVLIITDGADNASRMSLEQAIRQVQNLGGPVVYSIGLLFDDDKEEAQKAKMALQSLSAETGGIAYFPPSLDDVEPIAEEVARDIRNQYILGYHSTQPPSLGGYRRVRVEASTPRGGRLVVRTRKGYFPKAVAAGSAGTQAPLP
jgi:Ca-activated chloride channel family protein